jgi:hypothetical protein
MQVLKTFAINATRPAMEATHRLGVLMLTSDPIEYEKALPKGNGGRSAQVLQRGHRKHNV